MKLKKLLYRMKSDEIIAIRNLDYDILYEGIVENIINHIEGRSGKRRDEIYNCRVTSLEGGKYNEEHTCIDIWIKIGNISE